jgi:hypothetical protein
MFDVASDIRDRLDGAILWFLEKWELEGVREDNTIAELSDQDAKAVEILEALSATIDAIPRSIIKTTEELHDSLGSNKYEEFAIAAVQDVGYRSFPSNAAEFLSTLNLSLQFLARR